MTERDKMRACVRCKKEFELRPEDELFYQKMKVAPPTHCSKCRWMRRLAWRNERKLYPRTCAACHQDIISCFAPDAPVIVYCNKCWWGDQYDPYRYGRDFDFNRPFFEQFAELQHAVPHFALFQDTTSENCNYTNYGFGNKSCYMALCFLCENVYYSHSAMQTKDSIDVTMVQTCELCYECVDCASCSRLSFSQNCQQCHDSAFLVNCRNSDNCFGSINLNHKNYMFMNEQLTKDEYQKKIEAFQFTPENIEKIQKHLERTSSQSIQRCYIGNENVNSVGEYIDHCKNCYYCFDGLGPENSAYCDFAGSNSSELFDCCYGGVGSSLCYESMGFTSSQNILFQLHGRSSYDAIYTQYCYSSHHIFGSIGMKHGEYVILNKKYEPAAYEAMKDKIIAHMVKTGEWGEFFPMTLSPYYYNDTVAQEYFPMNQEEALKEGLTWKEESVPSVTESLAEDILQCKNCNKPYRIIPQEKVFYDKFHLPVPNHCPDCRHTRRFNLRRKKEVWWRNCQKCNMKIFTSFSPDSDASVYCEQCYQREFF